MNVLVYVYYFSKVVACHGSSVFDREYYGVEQGVTDKINYTDRWHRQYDNSGIWNKNKRYYYHHLCIFTISITILGFLTRKRLFVVFTRYCRMLRAS